MKNREPEEGDTAILRKPYLGCRRIVLIEQNQYTWTARICDSGLEIEVSENEFDVDE